MERKGFTLIELMVVLAIIVIIATASVPQVQLWTARNRGMAAVAQIISDFSKAKAIAAYSVTDTGVDGTGNYTRSRPVTTVMFRTSSYSIIQETGAPHDASPLKRTAFPLRVSLQFVNGLPTNDVPSSTPQTTFIFTSTGRLKRFSNDSLVPFGAGFGGLTCGGVPSPLNGKRIFNGILKAEITGEKGLWYRIEIDTSGQFSVCMMLSSDGNEPSFSDPKAKVLEL